VNWLKDVILKIAAAIGAFFSVKQFGKVQEQRDQAKRTIKERAKDAEIDSRPAVDSPFSRMRRD